MISFSTALDLLKQTGREVVDDNCMSMSAAIAYSTLFSLPPLLVIIVAVAGSVFGADAVQEQITEQMGSLVGPEGGEEIEVMIRNASDLGTGSVGGTIIGLLALLLGATGAFIQLQQSLNRAWEVTPDPDKGGIVSLIVKRVLSLGMVLTMAFLLLASLVVSAVLAALDAQLEVLVGGPVFAVLIHVLSIVVSLGLMTLLFAALFKLLPDAKIQWGDVWVGAAATAVLFTVGKTVIGLYLGNSDVGSAFGAAGSVVVILVWIYYTALILLVGAEFTQAWAQHFGSHIRPDDDAVRVIETTKIVREAASPTASEDAKEREIPSAAHPYTKPRDPQPRSGWNE